MENRGDNLYPEMLSQNFPVRRNGINSRNVSNVQKIVFKSKSEIFCGLSRLIYVRRQISPPSAILEMRRGVVKKGCL